jgi:hypothetical protein
MQPLCADRRGSCACHSSGRDFPVAERDARICAPRPSRYQARSRCSAKRLRLSALAGHLDGTRDGPVSRSARASVPGLTPNQSAECQPLPAVHRRDAGPRAAAAGGAGGSCCGRGLAWSGASSRRAVARPWALGLRASRRAPVPAHGPDRRAQDGCWARRGPVFGCPCPWARGCAAAPFRRFVTGSRWALCRTRPSRGGGLQPAYHLVITNRR